MTKKNVAFILSGVAVMTCMTACSGTAAPPSSSPATVAPAAAATPAQAPGASAEMAYIVVDLEECAQNLGRNTGEAYKAKGIELRLTRDQYVEFMRKEMYAYRCGEYASASDLVSIKCSIRLLDYLSQMCPDKKQWLADQFMAAFDSAYNKK